MNWRTVKLSDVCTISTGRKDVNESNANGQYPFFTCAKRHTYSDVYSFDCEAILIAGNGAVGQTTYFNGKFEAYQRTYVLSEFNNILPKLLLLILQEQLMKHLSYIVLGNTMPYIKKSMLENFELTIPPLVEQQHLLNKLDGAFADIDKITHSELLNNENIAKALDKYLLKTFLNISNDKINKEYELGEICKIVGGGTPSKKNPKFYEGEIPWATVRDMKKNIIENTQFKINKDAVIKSSTNVIPKGNVVIATRVGLGKVCILKNDTAINQDLKGIIPINPELIDINFLFYWFKYISKEIINFGTGLTVQGVKLPFIKSLKINLPSVNEQELIVKNIQSLQNNINSIKLIKEKKIINLKLLKNSFYKKLLNKNKVA